MSSVQPEFLSPKEVAQYVGVDTDAVYVWLRDGHLVGYRTPGRSPGARGRAGGVWRVRPSDVDAMLASGGNIGPSRRARLDQARAELRAKPLSPSEIDRRQDVACRKAFGG